MATTYHTEIQQLYVAYFNRPADPAGLAFWETVLEGNGGDTSVVSAEFAKSLEYTTEYDQLTTSGVVTQVYQNLFGHAPDSAGLAFWVKALNDKAMTVDTMVTEIAKGALGTDLIAYDSKVMVAEAFTAELDTDAEIAGFNTEDGLAAAKELIATIKTAAQATAAVAPATLEASVAAVVKAGTPFTLEGGLAALGAAKEAVADFLEAFDEGAVAADIEANLDAAELAVDAFVADPTYTTTTNAGVKAALLAEQEEIFATDLADAQEVLATEQEALEEVDGLADALSAAISADEAVEAADEAELVAEQAFAAEKASFAVANTVTYAPDGTATITIEGVTSAFIVLDGGELVLDDAHDAEDFDGVVELIAAGNTFIAAQADVAAAEEAATFAQLQVELLDADGTTLATAFTFNETTPADAAEPTFEEILDELSALTADAVTLRAAAEGTASGSPEDLAADAAEADLAAFEGQINSYITNNTTVLADAVVAANDAVEAAQENVDGLAEAVAELGEAEALVEELASLDAAVETAEDDLTDNDYLVPKDLGISNFATTGSDIFMATDVNATITSFGKSGSDVLFLGEGYTLNTGDLDDGVDSALEVFFIQSGSNTIVTIETKAYGSDSGDVQTITLTGVTATDLEFRDGIVWG